jgi:hypothetical protein
MTRPSDETLMAYADGALPEAERIAIEAYLAQDEEARRIVESFRLTSALAREAFDDAISAPPPADLVARILAAPTGQAAGADAIAAPIGSATVVPLPARPRRRAAMPPWLPLPLAASIALVIGVTAGFLTGRGVAPTPDVAGIQLGPVSTGTAIARVLDTATSGATTDRIAIVATFRDRGGRVCRELEVLADRTGQPAPEVAAVACRVPHGTWTVEGAARIARANAAGSGFEPSGASERDALQGLLDMLGADAALSPQEERTLIERGWR